MRLSLSVGINDYPDTGADLAGCVNDALGWSDLAAGAGYTGALLVDAAATKAAVVGTLRDMVARARFGDRILLTYSGHGSKVPDRDGDEADRWDECLVLRDFRAGGLLLDDELHAIFARRRFGVRALVISDSCHSGTMYRFAGYGRSPRFLPPTHFLSAEIVEQVRETRLHLARTTPRTTTALLSGCREDEYSYDAWIGGKPQGAFSHAALATYAPGQSLARWHARIRLVLPSKDYPQTPQLGATLSQRRWSL